ncbi:TetR/AcrR family transcriptional regulator [Pyruvatibacter sp.]|uniref:TetR/AcrR family transcriptional regulator n=1 Tax=Pyruvatibacter sp. TaxID=1981328 RepID=UPI0032EC8900
MTTTKAPKPNRDPQVSAAQDAANPKARIFAAASGLFLEGGVAALSVRAIAARAGISTIGIYSHFKGKQGILDALYVEGFEMVIDSMTVADTSLSPRDAILTAAAQYLDMAEAHTAHYNLIFGERGPDFRPSPEAEQVGARAFNTMAKLINALRGDDATPKQQQDAAVQTWALLHGYVSLRHHDVGRMVVMSDWKQQALAALGVLVEGLMRTTSSSPYIDTTQGL